MKRAGKKDPLTGMAFAPRFLYLTTYYAIETIHHPISILIPGSGCADGVGHLNDSPGHRYCARFYTVSGRSRPRCPANLGGNTGLHFHT
jgi:hypothetical protein